MIREEVRKCAHTCVQWCCTSCAGTLSCVENSWCETSHTNFPPPLRQKDKPTQSQTERLQYTTYTLSLVHICLLLLTCNTRANFMYLLRNDLEWNSFITTLSKKVRLVLSLTLLLHVKVVWNSEAVAVSSKVVPLVHINAITFVGHDLLMLVKKK